MLHTLTRPLRIVAALAFFAYELVLANARLAFDVAVPGRLPATTGILCVTTEARTEWEIWIIANAISMTPATLTLEVDAERDHLYIHTLYAGDRDAFTRQIAQLERVLLGAMR